MAVINGDENDNNISSGGTPRGDTLFSSTYGGNDTVSIFSPSYDVHLGDGNDRLAGGIGGFAYGEAGNDKLDVFLWEGTHAHYGGSGDDVLWVYYGGTGASYTGSGGSGTDQFRDGSSSPATLSFDGGSGYDVVTHSKAVDISLTLGGTGNQGGSSKTYTGIEAVVTNNGTDTLTGNTADNLMVGGGGSDLINGATGDDFLIGEGRESNFVTAYLGLNINFSVDDAYDPLNESFGGAYAIDSGGLNDTLYGGNGNDVLSGGDGADLLDGGNGRDWVTYLSAPDTGSLAMNLTTGGTLGHAAGDVFVGIENVQGSYGNDTLTGNSGANELRGMYNQDSLTGLGGNDTLDGGRGRDTLAGGKGQDHLTGGDAEDIFVFGGPETLLSVDTIADFQVGFDEIWLSAATFRKAGPLGALGVDQFALGAAATDLADRIIYDPVTGALSYDPNGSRAGSAVQFAQLATGLTLTEGDFVIIA